MQLDGTSDFVGLGDPVGLQLTGSMTVSAWINSASFPADDAPIVSKRNGSEVGYQLDTTIDRGPRTIGFKLTPSTGGQMFRYGPTAMQTNSWYHVAGVYNASTRELHVYLNGQLDDGALVGTVAAAQQNSTSDVNIGRRTTAGIFHFGGRIDDVRIYSSALTQAQIQADMNTPVGGSPPPDNQAPTAPTSLAGTAVGSTQVNLSWTASTDNVAVGRDRLERCLGAGCTTFAQIATPSGTSYSDTGLTAGTTYLYRVRAIDAAGNLSGYSNTANVTTPGRTRIRRPLRRTLGIGGELGAGEPVLDRVHRQRRRQRATGRGCLGAGCTTFAQIATPSGTSYSDTGLTAGTTTSTACGRSTPRAT